MHFSNLTSPWNGEIAGAVGVVVWVFDGLFGAALGLLGDLCRGHAWLQLLPVARFNGSAKRNELSSCLSATVTSHKNNVEGIKIFHNLEDFSKPKNLQ